MKRKIAGILAAIMVVFMLLGFAGCSNSESANAKSGSGFSDIAGDYYIDLTDLGMKLTIYLRIEEDGAFLFSNTTAFEVNKSDGTIQEADGEYIMVYSSVNGEEKSISEGITSKFAVADDGSLDFTVCERIYYGSATATTTSDDNPDAKLIAYLITEDYEAPSEDSEFAAGTYTAVDSSDNGTEYTYYASFYDDDTYLIFITYNENGALSVASETGRYGVSTTQLALTPQNGDRVSCDVLSNNALSLSIPVIGSDEQRNVIKFTKTDNEAQLIKTLKAEGADSVMHLYADGSFDVTTGDFTEKGLLAPDKSNNTFKPYPDHPTTGDRGLSQVATVPAGTLSEENGKLTLSDLRIRTSDSLNRDIYTFVEE